LVPWPIIIKLFPAGESLVSDMPAGDGKIANFFYSVETPWADELKRCKPVATLFMCGIYILPGRKAVWVNILDHDLSAVLTPPPLPVITLSQIRSNSFLRG
jgi:hypothetical protein